MDDDIIGESGDGLYPVLGATIGFFKYKMISLLFILFIFLNSSVFINRVLGKFSGAIDGISGTLNNWGIIIQGIFLIIGYVTFDILLYNDLI